MRAVSWYPWGSRARKSRESSPANPCIASVTTRAKSLVASESHTANTREPPGRSTRCASRRPRTRSGKNITPNWQATTSHDGSATGRSSASACWKRARPRFPTLNPARSSIDADVSAVGVVLDTLTLVDLTRGDLLTAGALPGRLRSNEAVHPAVALRVGTDGIITYDAELAAVAASSGLEVFAPA
jgi:predicted nucleic acid-binding protein